MHISEHTLCNGYCFDVKSKTEIACTTYNVTNESITMLNQLFEENNLTEEEWQLPCKFSLHLSVNWQDHHKFEAVFELYNHEQIGK